MSAGQSVIDGSAGGAGVREAHCVLWHAQDLPPSSELRSALDRRGMIVHRHDQRAVAFAEVCRLRGTRDGAGRKATILILVEPDRLNGPDAMLDVVARYSPSTACWLYRENANPQLRAVNDEDLLHFQAQRPPVQPRVAASIKSPSIWAEAKTARRATAQHQPVPSVIVGPRLKLAGSELTPATPGKPPAPKPETTVESKPSATTPPTPAAEVRQLLSEEELAMLLTERIGASKE